MSNRLNEISSMLNSAEDAVGAKLGLRRWPKAEDIDSFMPEGDQPEYLIKAMGDGTTTFILVLGTNALHAVAGGYITKNKTSINYDRITDVNVEKIPILGNIVRVGHSGQYTEEFAGVREKSASEFVTRLRSKLGKSQSGGTTQIINQEDSLQKMKNLKEMLDSGLISQSEYDESKRNILGI